MLCLCARERDLPHCGRPGGRRFKYFNHRSWHCCDRRQGRNLVVTDPTMRTRTARQLGLRAVLAARLLILLFRLQMLFTFPPGSYTPGATYKWYAFAINEAGGKSSASLVQLHQPCHVGPVLLCACANCRTNCIWHCAAPVRYVMPLPFVHFNCRVPGAPTISSATNSGSTMNVNVAPPGSNGGAGERYYTSRRV